MDATTAKRVKITVRLSPERLERARKAVARGRASSISAWVEEALRKHDNNFGWDDSAALWAEFWADWDREFGPPTEEEWARAGRILGLDP